MKATNTKGEYVFSIIIFLASCLGLAIFTELVVNFEYPEEFYQEEYFNRFTTINVVSRWANFSFFTYWSLIIFSLWGIFKFIATIFKIEKLQRIVNNSYLVLFVCLNQAIVMILYTVYQLAFDGSFSYYGPYPRSYHSLGTNLTVHYVITIIAIVYFFFHKFEKIQFKKCLIFLVFLVIYGTLVKITGMYCYSFDWYPYPIFSREAIWHTIFGNFNNYHPILALVILIFVLILLIAIYLLCVFLATKFINYKVSKHQLKKE